MNLKCSLYKWPWCWEHTASQVAALSLLLNDEKCKGSVLPFDVFTHLMVPHGNLSSAVLPVLGSSVGAKKWDRMCASVCERVCFCTLMSCLFFAGDSPSSLAVIQDLFSPSLYITANNIIETVCPVLSLPTPPPLLVPVPLPVLTYPTSLYVCLTTSLCCCTSVPTMGLWCDRSGTDALWPHPKHSVVQQIR